MKLYESAGLLIFSVLRNIISPYYLPTVVRGARPGNSQLTQTARPAWPVTSDEVIWETAVDTKQDTKTLSVNLETLSFVRE